MGAGGLAAPTVSLAGRDALPACSSRNACAVVWSTPSMDAVAAER